MHSAAWTALLARIPPDQHDKLMLVTTIGQEITLYTLLDLTEDYLAVRGRLAGSTDAGRIFFIPYDQINYLGFQKEMKESTFRTMFDLPEPPAGEANREPVTQDLPGEEPAVVAPELPPTSEPAPEPARPALPGKAALL